jgi:hypothetical protein
MSKRIGVAERGVAADSLRFVRLGDKQALAGPEIEPEAYDNLRERRQVLGKIGGHNRIVVSGITGARQILSAQG